MGGGGGICTISAGWGYQADNCTQCVSPLGITSTEKTNENEGDEMEMVKEKEVKEEKVKEEKEVKEQEKEAPSTSQKTTTTIAPFSSLPFSNNNNKTKSGTTCTKSYCCTCTCCSESYNGQCVSGAEHPFSVCVTGDNSNVCWGACESMIGGGGLPCSPPLVLPQPVASCLYC